MKDLLSRIVVTTFLFTLPLSLSAAAYSTEATVTLHKDKNQYEVAGRVCRLIEQDGKHTEEVIARPRVLSELGKSASFYVGLTRSNAEYSNDENVTMDVCWPKEGESGFGICTITVKRGDKIVSKSKMRVGVEDK